MTTMENISGMLFDGFSGITTTANATPILVRLKGEGSGRERTDQDGAVKLDAQGRKTFTVDGDVLTASKDGAIGVNRNVFLNSREPVTTKFDFFKTTFLKAEGNVTLKPFVSNGRLAWSITVDRLVPVSLQAEAPKSNTPA